MPFKSKKQQRFAFVTKQPWAKEFADETKKLKKGKKRGFATLPEKVEKMETSAFGVVHKSQPRNAKERMQRSARNGLTAGGVVGAAAGTGGYTAANYLHHKKQLKNHWDANEYFKETRTAKDSAYEQARWRANNGVEYGRTWVPGSTGEKFQSPKQESRVRRLRDLAGHPSTPKPEAQTARERLKSMGFSDKPSHQAPGGWKTTARSVPRPPTRTYTPKPWTHPGVKNILRNSIKLTGAKPRMAMSGIYGGVIGAGIGGNIALNRRATKERKLRRSKRAP